MIYIQQSIQMRVNKIGISKQTIIEYDKVIIKIDPPFEDFLGNITITEYDEWNSKQLSSKYLIAPLQKNVIKFEYQYLLIQTDHKDLITVIDHLLLEFIAYSIEYPSKYEPQMKVFKKDIDRFNHCFLASSIDGKMYRTFTFYYHQDIREIQEIQLRINRLSQLKEEVLVYSVNDEIRKKLTLRESLSDNDHQIFLKELVKIYSTVISKYIDDNMNRIGMQGSILIQKIDYFVADDQERLAKMKIDVNGFGERCGMVFVTYGYQEAYSKMHNFFKKWIEKLSITIVEVDSVECCRKDRLPDYFRSSYPESHAFLLQPTFQGKEQAQRILIFNPPKDSNSKNDLHHFFKCTPRIITGLQFPKCNFSLLLEYWNEFVNFSNLNLKVSIYQDYLIVNCSRGQERKLRERIEHFLENYILEEVHIGHFQNAFEISLFQAIYLRQITIKGVEFYLLNGQLYRSNYVKDGQELQKQLREIYYKLHKSLVFVPISRSLPIKKGYFRQAKASEWSSPQCLLSQQFKLQKKITINIRSFASISSNEQDCIFVVENINLCNELFQVLGQQGIMNIEQKLSANRILGFTLRKSRFFDNITTCMVVMGSDRETKWIKQLKQTFQTLISRHETSRHIKFMFHTKSHKVINVLLPIIIDSIRSNCNLRAECKLKEVTFFISLVNGNDLLQAIIEKLKEAKKTVPITRICELNLRTGELEKILTYGYYCIKYFQDDQTREASPLNSFIFNFQLRKKKKTPIFLPHPSQPLTNRRVEFLVSCFNQIAYKIIGSKIQKIMIAEGRLGKLKEIMKHYFPSIEYFVIAGNRDGSQLCERLFYTSTIEEHYKKLEMVDLRVNENKILIVKKVYLPYEELTNEFIDLKRVDTHVNKVPELIEIMNGVIL